MGISAGRILDMCTGHLCYPPRPAIEGSDDVVIEGRPALRNGDRFFIHCCGNSCHPGSLSQGSSTVTVNGRGIGYIGCAVDCGSALMTGSNTVTVGS